MIDRDLSILIYMNGGYEGGKIVFPNLDLSLKPTTGLPVAFAFNDRSLHIARPATLDARHALVCWAVVKNGPCVKDAPPSAAPVLDKP